MTTQEFTSVIMFPGQGSQIKGMGRDLFADYPSLTDQASDILGYSITELCLLDPENKLALTQFTQPALYVVNALAYLRHSQSESEKIEYFLGHSLGEYNALFAAGAFDFTTGIKLVKRRAELMANAGNGGMAAVVGMNEAQVNNILNAHPEFELSIANYNSPEQFVLSGNAQHIQSARSVFEKKGAKAYIPLKVSGAFHSLHMQQASEDFTKALAQISFEPLHTPVIANVSASLYENDSIGSNLVAQIVKPVKWMQSIAYLHERGIKNYLELGPGKVLSKLQRDIYNALPPSPANHSKIENIPGDPLSSDRNHAVSENNKDVDSDVSAEQCGIFSNAEIRSKFEKTTTLRQFVDAFDVTRFSLQAVTEYHGERGQSLNYGELKAQIEFLGSALLSLGVTKGERIGLLAENRVEWPLTYLAVASIGAVIVPVDVFLGEEELVEVIARSNIAYCFCSANYIERLAAIAKSCTSLKKIVSFDTHALLLESAIKLPTKKILSLAETLQLIEEKEFQKASPFASRQLLFAPSLIKLGEKNVLQGDEKYKLTYPHSDDVAAVIFMTENRFAELSHRGIMANLFGILDVLDEDGKYLQPGERSLAVLPFHHTFPTMGGFLLPLAGYLEVILLSRFTAKRFIKTIKTESINYSVVVPYLLEAIDKELDKTGATLDSMKFIFIGGAAVKKYVLESIEKKGCTVVQGYGLTEYSPVVTVNTPSHNCLGSIGKPIAGVQIRIHKLNSEGHGELWVRGPSLMKGYSGLESETRAVVEDGWLKTGDIACENENGFLFISGRKKAIVVNSGGKNIYPEEIEKIVAKDKYIKNINIFPWIDPVEGECPHAILFPDYDAIQVLESELGKTLASDEINTLLLRKIDQSTVDIANYKVPKHIFIANREGLLPENCPQVPNETAPFMFLDYYFNARAEDMQTQVMHSERSASTALTQTADQQANRIKDFLVKQINLVIDREGTTEDFDSLDELDSIVKLKLKFNIEKLLDTRLAISLLVKCQSVNELTANICNDNQFAEVKDRILQLNADAIPQTAGESPSVFKLTEMQEAFLVSKHFSSGKDEVGCHIYLEIEENDLQYDRLKAAWSKLSKAHAMLHAKIIDENTQILVPAPNDFDFVSHDLRFETEGNIALHIQNRRNVLQQKFYSSDDWPLYTIEVTDLPENKSIIHFSIDEWIVDGMSLWTLLRQWYQLYKNLDAPLPIGVPGFNDYQFALQSSSIFRANDADLQYWLTKLSGMPEAPLLQEKQVQQNQNTVTTTTFVRERLNRTIGEAAWGKLTGYCKKINISPTALLLSAFNEVLSAYSQHEKFSLILTFFNRKPVVQNVENIIGPFISTNIFIHNTSVDTTVETTAQRVQEQLWADMDHSNISAIRCVREMKNRKLLGNDFMLPVVFTSMLTNENSAGAEDANWLSRVGYSVTQTPGVYLDHQTFVLNHELCISWDYAKGYFASDLIIEMIDTYTHLLGAMATAVDSLSDAGFNDLLPNKISNNQTTIKLPAQAEERFSPFPLSPIQQSYFINQIGFGSDKKNNCLVYQEIEINEVAADTIINAWNLLIEQHDALRTVITSDGRQQVHKALQNIIIENVDLKGLSSEQLIQECLSIRQEMQGLFFPVDIGPFWQVRLSSSSEHSHCFHIAIDMLLCDANSMQLLFKQLISVIQGHKPYFSKLRYRDFAMHQKNENELHNKNVSKTYWRTKFKKMYPGPSLPALHASEEKNISVNRQRFESVLEDWPNLVSQAGALNVPVSSVILTIYAETILAWTQNTPFTLVVVNWNRPAIHDINQIVGDFTQISWIQVEKNTLPFSEKVLYLHRQLMTDLAHKNGLGELGRFVAKNRNSAASNLSVVLTNFMSHGTHTLPSNIKFSYGLSQTPGVTMDNISVELDGALHFHWDVNTSVYSHALIADMFAGYSRVISALAAEQNTHEGIWINTNMDEILRAQSTQNESNSTESLSVKNNSALIKAWNNTYRDYPLRDCLHYLIEDQVLRSPYRIAVQFEQNSLSFFELNQRANQLAHLLIKQGLKSGSVVALVQDRSIELMVSLLAILKAGAAYLPIDTNFPEERITYIVKDATASVVLTQSKFSQKLAGLSAPLVLLDKEHENLANFPGQNFERTQSSDDLAYIIYTSGSTGNPKGCMIPHSAIVNRLLWMRDEYQVNERDRVLQKTPYTFDVSVWEFFLPLLCGSTLVLAKPKGHQDPGYLSELIREEKITVCHFVPSMLNAFLNEPSVSQCTSLSRVFTSGEALSYASIEKFLSLLNCELHNLYGPTEAAVDVSYWHCQLNSQKQVFIGKPVANTQLYIADTELQPVKLGETGEILIGGVQVAKGYLAQEKLTAEKFIPNHFSEKSGEKLYRTGDLGRQFEDGNIEYLGRRDSQVKLRGLRIELGEIETRLCELAEIRTAIVRVRDENTDDPKLVAWLVGANKQVTQDVLSLKFVRQELKKILPDYMLPNAIVMLDSLPTTEHGKLNEKALPWPSNGYEKVNDIENSKKEVSKPEISKQKIEALLTSILTDAMNISEIKPTDDLFDLGATSLTLVKLAQKVKQSEGINIPVEVFLDDPSIAGISSYIANTMNAGSTQASSADDVDTCSMVTPVQNTQIKENRELLRHQFSPEILSGLLAPRLTAKEQFDNRPVSFNNLSALLSLLAQQDIQGRMRYRYPSGGGKNAVQTYVYINDGRVESLDGGFYYYHPIKNKLVRLPSQQKLGRDIFNPVHQNAFVTSAFAVFLIAEYSAIEPFYADASTTLIELDAGYITQLLQQHASTYHLGMLTVDDVAFAQFQESFLLSPSQQFVSCILGVNHSVDAGIGYEEKQNALLIPSDNIQKTNILLRSHEDIKRANTSERYCMLSKEELAIITAEARHLRNDLDHLPAIALNSPVINGEDYVLRACQREYKETGLSQLQLGQLMSLMQDLSNSSQQKLYAADALPHQVNAYVLIKSGGMQDNSIAGLYLYNDKKHSLEKIDVDIEALTSDIKSAHVPFNRTHYQKSKVNIFLIGNLEKTKDNFSNYGIRKAYVEAGKIGQLMMQHQSELDLGVCPIGGMRFDTIRHYFNLHQDQLFLHCMLVGAWDHIGQISSPIFSRKNSSLTQVPTEYAINVINKEIRTNQKLAIIGVAGRYPQADSLDEYWQLLQQGKSAISEIPQDRWDAQLHFSRDTSDKKSYSKWGGFLKNIKRFDSLLFKMSPSEAKLIDPQERLFLEVIWECLENSSYTSKTLKESAGRVGVFVGVMWSDYQSVAMQGWDENNIKQAISFHSSIANRVSHFFDFEGPSLAIDSSCSSALSAMHLARQSIAAGECDAAIVGGINLIAHPYHQNILCGLNLLSQSETCDAFGENGTGWVVGEGVGAVLVRPEANARSARDNIHANLLATSISHSGATLRYGFPSSDKQAKSISACLSQAGVFKQDISYIESAATGSGLADSVESEAIKIAFANTDMRQSIAIGSVKPNIGHLESASFMSQLTKVLLQFKHGKIAPSINSEPRNPLINYSNSSFYINTELKDWTQLSSQPKYALINSFGATGSGGHVVLEEAPRKSNAMHKDFIAAVIVPSVIVPLSAQSRGQLILIAQALLQFINSPDAAFCKLSDIAFTLQEGRVALKQRVAFVVSSLDELKKSFEIFIKNPEFTQLTKFETQNQTHADAQLYSLAAKWMANESIDWRVVQSGNEQRIALPTYPFNHENHWLTTDLHADTAFQSAIGQSYEANKFSRENMQMVNDNHTDKNGEGIDSGLMRSTQTWLRTLYASLSGIPESTIDVDTSLIDYGINSVIIKSINEEIDKHFKNVSKTVMFECQTISDLAAYLLNKHRTELMSLLKIDNAQLHAPAASQTYTKASVRREYVTNRDIAVIGMAGRYPQAENLDQFWNNLCAGKDCIIEVPEERWRIQDFAMKNRWGGFIKDVDKFDPLFFNISPTEAKLMDPQERQFLEVAWESIENAGYTREYLQRQLNGQVGVFVGVMYSEYQLFAAEEIAKGNMVSLGNSIGSIANRVSYVMNFKGPSMTVDTLCSSSLTAVHMAVQSMKNGECDAAIVGGVNLSLHPSKYLMHAQMNMPSSNGRCSAFGDQGDGLVAGEGVGSIVIKWLDAALADGDQILGVIKATTVNHDGKTNGYTVPNPVQQGELIKAALTNAQIDAADVSYIEAHGTGTALGDPIEVNGLTRAFEHYGDKKQYCAIGSVKSNIGHLEAASGIASITKVLLQMRHKKLVPSLHTQTLNRNIQFDDTPFYVQRELSDWLPTSSILNSEEKVGKRIAGISSFGAGGANAHIILEAFEKSSIEEQNTTEHLFVLSAKNKLRLTEYVNKWIAFLEQQDHQLPTSHFADLLYTTQIGREAFSERLAILADSPATLLTRLREFDKQNISENSIFSGNIVTDKSNFGSLVSGEEAQELIDVLIKHRNLTKLAKLWVSGTAIDWHNLHQGRTRQRVSVPSYPFARESYWVPQMKAQLNGLATVAANNIRNEVGPQNLHPLLDQHSASLSALSFSKTFSAQSAWVTPLADNQNYSVNGTVLIEMLHAAASQVGEEKRLVSINHLHWAEPKIPNESSCEYSLKLYTKTDNNAVQCVISALDKKANDLQEVALAELVFAPVDEIKFVEGYIDCKLIKSRCEKNIAESTTYPSLRSFYYNKNEALVQIECQETTANTDSNINSSQRISQEFLASPALLQNALQAAALFHSQLHEVSPAELMSASILQLDIHRKISSKCHLHIVPSTASVISADDIAYDIALIDGAGRQAIKLGGVTFTQVASNAQGKAVVTSQINLSQLEYNKTQWFDRHINVAESLDGTTLVFDTDDGLCNILAETTFAEKTKGDLLLIKAGKSFKKITWGKGQSGFQIDLGNEDHYAQLLAEFNKDKKDTSLFNIIHNWSKKKFSDGNNTKEQLDNGLFSLNAIAKQVVKFSRSVKILYLYDGKDIQPCYEACGVFLKTLSYENPKINIKTLATEPDPKAIAQQAVNELAEFKTHDYEIRYQGGQRKVKHYLPCPPTSFPSVTAGQDNSVLRKNGVYLITGGMGGLGLLFAKYLSEHYQARLILTGRRYRDAQLDAQLKQLQQLGGEVVYLSCDISDTQQAQDCRALCLQSFGEINGIVHAAGVLKNGLIANKKVDQISEVLQAKVAGTMTLDKVFAEDNLDFVAYFSSIIGVMGNIGQSDYAFANAFQNHYARYRNTLVTDGKRNGRSVSINWPLWQNGGMSADAQTEAWMEQSLGFVSLTSRLGLLAFEEILKSQLEQVIVLSGFSKKINETLAISGRQTSNRYDTLRLTQCRTSVESFIPVQINADAAQEISISSKADKTMEVAQFLRAKISEATGVTEDKIDDTVEFWELGLDSILSMKIIEKIEAQWGLRLYPNEMLEYNNVQKLSAYLKNEISAQPEKESTDSSQSLTESGADSDLLFSTQTQEISSGTITSTSKLLPFLKTQVAAATGVEETQIDVNVEFWELGLDSILSMKIIENIEHEYGIRLYPNEMLEYNTLHKLEAYLSAELAASVKTEALPQLSQEMPSSANATEATSSNDDVHIDVVPDTTSDFDWKSQVTYISAAPAVKTKMKKKIIFVLSTPRSGSTLFRVMLAGHSGIFSPPELHLLPYNTLDQWSTRLIDLNQKHIKEGLTKAIAELESLSAEKAIERLDNLQQQGFTVKQTYNFLLERAQDRFVIDKSPNHALDINTLRNAESVCDEPLYIHLVRHPIAVMESFVRNRFAKMFGVNENPWEYAGNMWLDMNKNILQHLSQVPASRTRFIRYEDLVAHPENILRSLCTWLDVPFEAEMLKPYEGNKMTSGLREASMSIGDPNFNQHKKIESHFAENWKLHADKAIYLPPSAIALAQDFGYLLELDKASEHEKRVITPIN